MKKNFVVLASSPFLYGKFQVWTTKKDFDSKYTMSFLMDLINSIRYEQLNSFLIKFFLWLIYSIWKPNFRYSSFITKLELILIVNLYKKYVTWKSSSLVSILKLKLFNQDVRKQLIYILVKWQVFWNAEINILQQNQSFSLSLKYIEILHFVLFLFIPILCISINH